MHLALLAFSAVSGSASAQVPRDPFAPLLITGCGPVLVGLQRWAPAELVLVGVATMDSGASALVRDPEGGSWVLHLGDYVGPAWGRVTSISADGLVVTEELETVERELIVNTVRVPLGTGR